MSAAAPRQRLHTFLVLKQAGKPDRVVVWDTQDISLGRAPENDLCIDHSEVSRRHALFSRTDRAFVVKNMSMSNGTYVNGQAVDSHELASRDVVQIGDLQLHFYQVTRNPATLGPKLDYSSQLKDFGPARGANPNASPDSTMLGLVDSVDADEDEFEVRPASDFAYDLHQMELRSGPAPRNLDMELEDLEMPGEAAGATIPAAVGRLSLHLEIEGLSPDLGRQLGSLLGKVLELPPLRIRIKGDDRG
jgi:hypothetical protein